jgi:hypothetical protein
VYDTLTHNYSHTLSNETGFPDFLLSRPHHVPSCGPTAKRQKFQADLNPAVNMKVTNSMPPYVYNHTCPRTYAHTCPHMPPHHLNWSSHFYPPHSMLNNVKQLPAARSPHGLSSPCEHMRFTSVKLAVYSDQLSPLQELSATGYLSYHAKRESVWTNILEQLNARICCSGVSCDTRV